MRRWRWRWRWRRLVFGRHLVVERRQLIERLLLRR